MAADNGDHPKCIEDVRRLIALNGEISAGLRSQQKLLRVRHVTVPNAALQGTAQIDTALSQFENLLLDEETELEQLRALMATSALINTSLDLDEVLAQAMDEIINLTGAGRGFIILRDRDSAELDFRISRAPDGDMRVDISRTIIEEVLTTREPLLTDNASSDPRVSRSQTVGRFTLRSILCVPLIYKDMVRGAIYVDNRFREAVFTEREMTLLMAFANQAAIAIENAILFAQVQATLDEITHVKDLMENVFASIASGVITTNAEDSVTTYNRAAAQILATPTEQAIGKPLSAIMPGAVDLDGALHEVRDGRSAAIRSETQIIGRGRVELNLKFSPLKNATQETQGVTLVLDDLTEQREREQMLDVMTRYLPPGMVDNIHQIAELALGGERREVTCMFLYACPYSAFPVDLPPQALMQLLNQYLATATTAVHGVRGIIDKYMGNEVMVLFNTQLNPSPDHALCAVEGALVARDAFCELYARLGMKPDPHLYRIGIHTGVATLGNVGSLNRRNFSAIGDSINLSKRLEETAAPGQIIISEDTLQHITRGQSVPASIHLAERGAVQVRGRTQQTRIYEVYRHA